MIDYPFGVGQGKVGAAEGGVPPHPALRVGCVAGIGQLNNQLGRNSATDKRACVAQKMVFFERVRDSSYQ